MKKLFLLALGAVAVFSACNKSDNSNPGPDPTKARVMFVHTTLSADTLRVKGNNSTIVNSLAPLTSSGYVEVTPGSNTLGFYLAQSNLLLKDTTYSLTANNSYSVFSSGAVNSPSVFITSDDLSAPVSGNAKIRFANLSQEGLSERFYVGANLMDTAIKYRNITPFRSVTAGNLTILLQDPYRPTVIKQFTQQFDAGKIYTIVLTGINGGAGNADLRTTVFTNN